MNVNTFSKKYQVMFISGLSARQHSGQTHLDNMFAPNISNSIGRPDVQTDLFRCVRGIFHDVWNGDRGGRSDGWQRLEVVCFWL